MNNKFELKITQSKFTVQKSKTQALLVFIRAEDDESDLCKLLNIDFGIQVTAAAIKKIKANTTDIFRAGTGRVEYCYIRRVVVEDDFSEDYFRNFFAAFVNQAADAKIDSLHILLPAYSAFKDFFASYNYLVQSCVEGMHYANYTFSKYKQSTEKQHSLAITLHSGETAGISKAISAAAAVMKAVAYTRDLQNEPGNVLYPRSLAESITKQFRASKVKVTTLNEKQLLQKKMGGILAVGGGSAHPPRLIVLEYAPINAKKHIAIVGKGITFDSGGISIKPAGDMWEMKGDMSGAAVVAGVMIAASELNLPIKITGIIPAAENLPSGTSFRPGDIVTTSSGKTIEIDNTDAEGRVILADALHFASQKKPDEIIDLATLTGACVVALGEFVAGLFTKNDRMAEELLLSGKRTGELAWRLPLFDRFNQLNKSDVADVKNTGGRWGGAISAAKFLENWVDKTIPWTHLDIAGPSMPNKFSTYSQPYMTGFGVRLLLDYLQ